MVRLQYVLFALFVATIRFCHADASGMQSLERQIGQMVMVGFYGTEVGKNDPICQDIQKGLVGGVILFDYNPRNPKKAKNILNKARLKRLTSELQACAKGNPPLLIAVDQEGGKVQRLKSKYGFYGRFPGAQAIGRKTPQEAYRIYRAMARELAQAGINYNLAPVVDLALNPANRVIVGLKRSYGKDPSRVASYAKAFILAMHKEGVLTSLKHFPGHGSSLGDTHKGYVDVTKQWRRKELEPYKLLKEDADSVMVAHVFNARIDPLYPATLSHKTVEGLLRQRIGFEGVAITDDLQMGAITKRYTIDKTLYLAIKAGNDILLFGNQLASPLRGADLVSRIVSLIQNKKISKERIAQSYRRILHLKEKLK